MQKVIPAETYTYEQYKISSVRENDIESLNLLFCGVKPAVLFTVKDFDLEVSAKIYLDFYVEKLRVDKESFLLFIAHKGERLDRYLEKGRKELTPGSIDYDHYEMGLILGIPPEACKDFEELPSYPCMPNKEWIKFYYHGITFGGYKDKAEQYFDYLKKLFPVPQKHQTKAYYEDLIAECKVIVA